MCFYLGIATDGENICLDKIAYKISGKKKKHERLWYIIDNIFIFFSRLRRKQEMKVLENFNVNIE